MKRIGPLLALVLALAATGQPSVARAESAGEQAIAKGELGVAAYERGDWAEALAAFEQAEQLFHSPVFVLYKARSLRNQGRLREAKRHFEQLAGEVLAEKAPSTWRDAKANGQSELASLRAELPSISVVAKGSSLATVVQIDEERAALGTPFTVDPGEHTVKVSDGATVRSKTVTVGRSEPTKVVELDLRTATLPSSEPDHGWLFAGITLSSLGAAGLIGGGVSGGLALGLASDAEKELPKTCTADRRCLPEDEAAIEAAYADAYQLSHVADGLFIGGGTLLLGGLVIVIVDQTGSKDVRPLVSARGVGVAF